MEGEVGQKFDTDALEGEQKDVMVNGLFNFAKLSSFEEMVELPGTSVTSVVS